MKIFLTTKSIEMRKTNDKNMLTNLITVIIFAVTSHYIVHLKLTQYLMSLYLYRTGEGERL